MRIVLREEGAEYPVGGGEFIRTPTAARDAAREIAPGDTESMVVLILSSKNRLISSEIITTGLLDSNLCHPREVFRPAILRNGAAVVLVHNHPSGDTTPSSEDIRVTQKLVSAGLVVGISVLDHIVIGAGAEGLRHLSMREEGLVDFTGAAK